MQEKAKWGEYWFLGEILIHQETCREERRETELDSSLRSFKSFITNMDIEEIKAEVGCLHRQIIGKERILLKKNWIDFLGQLAG